MVESWFETSGPLPDGWYIWKTNEDDIYPDFIEVSNGFIIEYAVADSHGVYYTIEEHTDYRGLWHGPIAVPE